MASVDPWFDWLLDFGSLEGFSPLPPEFAAIDGFAGSSVDGWQDEEGNIRPVLDPFPPLPQNAPDCARAFYSNLAEALGFAWFSARRYCSYCPLRLWINPFSDWQAPLTYIAFLIACGDEHGANWGDPCASGGLSIPQDCDYLRDWLSGYFRKDCPDRVLTTEFSPAVHRLVSEIVKPSGRAFVWRLEYDQPVFWPLVFNPEVLTENNACKSWALAILLQVEALQDLLNQVQTPKAYLRFFQYFDGILLGRKYVVLDENGLEVGQGFIGYNPTLELGFCLGEKVFRNDVGRVGCDDGEDDEMGCSCEEIRIIVQEELAKIRDDYLDPINSNALYLRNLFEPIEDIVSQFFSIDGENAWTRFLSRFSFLSSFLRPSNTDPDTVITPPLPDRIDEYFERTKARQRAILSNVSGLIRVFVKFSAIQGERNTSRDTWIPPASIRPYNHYGQVWVEYAVNNGAPRRSAWQWIRSRDSEHVFLVPDLRTSASEQVQISAKYQLFAGLTTSAPLVQVLLPEVLTSDYWV
jgi:hypothetical protein